jgi:small GTP-binding protein
MKFSAQENHLNQARASLQQALSWYSGFNRHGTSPPNFELQGAVRSDLQALKACLDKLEQKVVRIALFGLVSRGKSAVVNALLGEKVLLTGPLHGVTKWPRSVAWTPASGKVKVELIDTPGLDEIEGEAREEMAREVAAQADLILFVIAGDITNTEYQALCDLKNSRKPLILVFNKIDLYPEVDREAIWQQLQGLGAKNLVGQDEIVMVAAEPQALPMRVEYPDGKVVEEWEEIPPIIDDLKRVILTILNREGRSLLALNALLQAEVAEKNIAQKTLELRQKEAEVIIWKYAKYKAIAVAVNPIIFLDLIAGIITDLSLIRALAKLYGLPMTSYQAGNVWRKIMISSGSLLLAEIVSSIFFGLGKGVAGVTGITENPSLIFNYASMAALQGGVAGYGAYIVGKIAQEYLANGCSWGNLGVSTVIENIINQSDSSTIIARLFNWG